MIHLSVKWDHQREEEEGVHGKANSDAGLGKMDVIMQQQWGVIILPLTGAISHLKPHSKVWESLNLPKANGGERFLPA